MTLDKSPSFWLDFLKGQEGTTSAKSGKAGFIFPGVGAFSYSEVEILILC